MGYCAYIFSDELSNGEIVYVSRCPELPGCMSQGNTIDEAYINLQDAIALYVESLREDGVPVPLPFDQRPGTFGGHLTVMVAYDNFKPVAWSNN